MSCDFHAVAIGVNSVCFTMLLFKGFCTCHVLVDYCSDLWFRTQIPLSNACHLSYYELLMSSAAMMGVELTEESKELFSIAYQNVASGKRASLRRLESVEKTEKSKGNLTSVRMVKAYRQKVKDELIRLCHNMLELIDIHLLPHSLVPRSWILLNKM